MHMMCRRGMTHDVSCQPGTTLVGRRFTFATPEKLRAAAQVARGAGTQSSTTVRHPTPTWLGADPD